MKNFSLTLFCVFILSSCSQLRKSPLEPVSPGDLLDKSLKGEQLILKDFAEHIACKPTMLSRGPYFDTGVGKDIEVEYGPYEVERNDIPGPDGTIKLRFKGTKCSYELNQVRGIYVIGDTGKFLVEDSLGSVERVALYDLSQDCELFGWVDISGRTTYKRDIHTKQPACTGDLSLP